jgi:hypothetical protein
MPLIRDSHIVWTLLSLFICILALLRDPKHRSAPTPAYGEGELTVGRIPEMRPIARLEAPLIP